MLVSVSVTGDWTGNERSCHVSIREGGSSLCADEGQCTRCDTAERNMAKQGWEGGVIFLDSALPLSDSRRREEKRNHICL